MQDILDTIIVGAGPAGLTAAIYLGRFRRSCLVLEDGHSRAQWIPTSHNIPGFSAGVGGREFLRGLREQAVKYGAQVRRARVSDIRVDDGIFVLRLDAEVLRCRFVLLATGVQDHLPPIGGAPEAVMRSLLRFCPICDAYEAIDQRIAVIGDGPLGEREALFLRDYSAQITVLHLGSAIPSGPLHDADDRIERVAVRLSYLHIREDRLILASETGERSFDVVYLALGCSSQNALARSLGARCDEHGALEVNAHQETTVPGLYAAGDVVRGLNQIVVAAAESAIAATDIHNKLRSRIWRG
jgi:thioredoxin reductase (NADPH)